MQWIDFVGILQIQGQLTFKQYIVFYNISKELWGKVSISLHFQQFN